MTKINDKQPTKTYVLSDRLSICLDIDPCIGDYISIFSNKTGGYFYNNLNIRSCDYVDREKLKGLADFINNYLENN